MEKSSINNINRAQSLPFKSLHNDVFIMAIITDIFIPWESSNKNEYAGQTLTSEINHSDTCGNFALYKPQSLPKLLASMSEGIFFESDLDPFLVPFQNHQRKNNKDKHKYTFMS